MSDNFNFWVNYLKIISIFFAVMGAMWALVGSFDPFGVYDAQFAKAFWQTDSLPPDAKRTFNFVLGPFGATSMGYFILQYFIATHAYARREKWAYQAVVTAFVAWLVLDSLMSARHGAYFNILMANVPALVALTDKWCRSVPAGFPRRYLVPDGYFPMPIPVRTVG